MPRRKKRQPPRPGMKWSEKHQMWLDPDSRTPERRRKDDEILKDVEADRERVDTILREVREAGAGSRDSGRIRRRRGESQKDGLDA